LPVVPQASVAPSSQTLPVVVVSPEAMHTFEVQQPPPRQAPPAQHGSPTPPHATHDVPLHRVSAVLQSTPLLTHLPSAASQHPPGQELPAQHTRPLVPQPVHAPPEQTVSNAVHARSLPTQVPDVGSQQSPAEQLSPAQQGCPTPPHALQDEPEHTVLAAVHAVSLPTQVLVDGSQQSPVVPGHELPAQHAAPVVPQATHVPAAEQTSPLPEHVFAAQQG
jgi:hypothetical protein